MQTTNKLQQCLDALGRATGARFTLEANGWATLQFDNATEITVGADEALGLIFMLAPVCSLTESSRATLMQEALEMALLGLGTGGCILGYDRAHDQLMLSISHPHAALDGPHFVNAFSQFVDVVSRLKNAFQQAQGNTQAHAGAGAVPAEVPRHEFMWV